MDEVARRTVRKGRGAVSNESGRFETERRVAVSDGWDQGEAEDEPAPLPTTLIQDSTRTIITRNNSPDIGFDRSINPYRGCEHGCIYCFARPSHAYLGLSPGLDFETRIFIKPEAPRLLAAELAHPGYQCRPMALGTNTDPYQPAERKLGITRGILEILQEHRHPVSIVTKSALVLRDLDLLGEMARDRLATVTLSVTTLDGDLARAMEPRASTPRRRLQTIEALARAGIPTGVLAAPMIPALNDCELEAILEAARTAGAASAGYVLLRLPHELKALFREWLEAHAPGRARHVLSLVAQMHGGRDYDSRWGIRQTGEGRFAELLRVRFELAAKRLRLRHGGGIAALDATRFRRPPRRGDQLSLL